MTLSLNKSDKVSYKKVEKKESRKKCGNLPKQWPLIQVYKDLSSFSQWLYELVSYAESATSTVSLV